MKKLSITLLTLSLASTLLGQNTNDKKEDVKKEEQSENHYKESSNFYINSDGLVVYKRSGSSTQNNDSINHVTPDSKEHTTTADYNIAANNDEPTLPKSTPVIVRKEAYDNTNLSQQDKGDEV